MTIERDGNEFRSVVLPCAERGSRDETGVDAYTHATRGRTLTTDVTSSNGLSPLINSNNNNPTPQTSLDLAYVSPRRRSGDMYLVVPIIVRFIIVPPSSLSMPSELIAVQRISEIMPKSASLTRPVDDTRTFAGC